MTSDEEKAARLAAALRANLAKRKAQKRARAEPASAGENAQSSGSHEPELDPPGTARRESGEG